MLISRKNRDYKTLDIFMRHLRYLKRFDPRIRAQIYKYSTLEKIPNQTVIFKTGDTSDYMYIILKGRVIVTSSKANYKDIPVVLSILSDGDQFGDLSAVDESRLK
jgi:CRP-like cAMP-binding protein